jgi:hypothetical protein
MPLPCRERRPSISGEAVRVVQKIHLNFFLMVPHPARPMVTGRTSEPFVRAYLSRQGEVFRLIAWWVEKAALFCGEI